MAQSGSARGLGPRGRRFKSCLPDHYNMTKHTIIFLVRHGESKLNEEDIIAGQIDTPLTDRGKKQALETRRELDGVNFDNAYSSDLKRAIETGEIIYGKPIPKTNQIKNLRERTFGSLEGKPEHHQKPGNEKKKKISDHEAWHFKHVSDMESDYELSDRFMTAFKEIAKQNSGKTILVVAHGGPVRTTIMSIRGLGNKNLPAGSFRNAGYVKLEYNGTDFEIKQIVGATFA